MMHLFLSTVFFLGRMLSRRKFFQSDRTQQPCQEKNLQVPTICFTYLLVAVGPRSAKEVFHGDLGHV